MRIAVVGAGVTGLSVAFHLAKEGAEVVVHEQTGVGAEASGVQPGGVRQQWSTRVNCLLARESTGFYREIGERLEPRVVPVLEPCGYVFLAHSGARRAALAADVGLQNGLGIPSQLLEPEDLPGLLPGIDTSDVTAASFCAEDGYFDRPQGVVEAFAEACRRRGVTIERSTITGLVERPEGWRLEREAAGPVEADAVVVAAGYDAPALLATVGVELPIVKEARYLLLSDPIADRLLEPLVVSAERRFAAKHLRAGRVLASDLAADGDPDGNASAWRAHVKETARRLVPVLEYVTYPIVVEGYYDVTPDHQPVVAPVEDGLWVAAGFSGHGFMIAPAVGRIVADALLAGRPDPALECFALDRFARGSLAPELQIV
ncbi:MAG TPA: FAD-dependent oxidoreductase [Gaiella sp.]|jgi:sarcosine oxidase subunit beta